MEASLAEVPRNLAKCVILTIFYTSRRMTLQHGFHPARATKQQQVDSVKSANREFIIHGLGEPSTAQ